MDPLNSSESGDKPARSFSGPLVWAVIGIILLLVIWALYTTISGAKKPGKPTMKQITMVKIQTPPPPPKPPEKPPEPPPPKPKDEVKLDEPKPAEPKPAATPEAAPAPKLGIDAQGSGPGDGFGLAAGAGRPDLSPATIGGPGLGGAPTAIARAQYTFYRDVMVRHLTEILGRIPELRDDDLQIPVAVWLDRNGKIEKVEIQSQSMSADRIQLVRNALLNGPSVRQLPPDNMPQPLRLKVRVQDAG